MLTGASSSEHGIKDYSVVQLLYCIQDNMLIMMRLKRGYQIVSYEKIEAENGDFLCYHTMEKRAGKEAVRIEKGL